MEFLEMYEYKLYRIIMKNESRYLILHSIVHSIIAVPLGDPPLINPECSLKACNFSVAIG